MTDAMANAPSPCVVLCEAQLAENIGAAARVMANFGLEDLRLVRPRDGWPQERAWASASGADWPLDQARVCDSLAEALADRTLALAASARPREAGLPVLDPRAGAALARREIAAGGAVALVFGNERAGLSADDIARCQAIISAPVHPRFRSLNLAQAVALCAYEWRLAELAGTAPDLEAAPRPGGPPAPLASVEGLMGQLTVELDAAGFFHPPEKRPSMVRNLSVALGRARLSEQEVRTLRGVVTALSKGRGRVLAKLAARAGQGEGGLSPLPHTHGGEGRGEGVSPLPQQKPDGDTAAVSPHPTLSPQERGEG